VGTRVAELKFAGSSICGVELSAASCYRRRGRAGDELSCGAAVDSAGAGGARLAFFLAWTKSRARRFWVRICGSIGLFCKRITWHFSKGRCNGFLRRRGRESRSRRYQRRREWLAIPRQEALRQFEDQIRKTLSLAKEAKLLRGVTVIEKRSTFAPLQESTPASAPGSPTGGHR